jgi:hypothetical protein
MSRKEKFEFTADQIGSEVLARFSEDIYSPKAIIRELDKNAYDSYFELEHAFPGSGYDALDRVIRIDVVGNAVIVADDGLGLDIPTLKRLLSIALTEKREIEGVTGFRGIGFWSAYTGGDTIVVESTRLGSDRSYRLTLNTRRMRELQRPNTSIGAIMNDPKCVELVSDPASKDDHYTKVLVRAENEDGRLYHLIRDPKLMRRILLEGCSCRLADRTRHEDRINGLYDAHSIQPARLMFQGAELRREIPTDAGDFLEFPLEIDIGGTKQSVAWVWHATNTKNAGFDSPIAGIRVLRDSFPIGLPNLYSHRTYHDSKVEVTRPDLLDWHIGEVHLLHDLLRPNAGGEDVRDSVLFTAFRDQLRLFYEKKLVPISRAKQKKATLRREYTGYLNKLNAFRAKVKEGEGLDEQDKKSVQEIIAQINRHNEQAKGRRKAEAGPASQEVIVRDGEIKSKRRQIGELLVALQEEAGLNAEQNKKKEKKPKKPAATGDSATAANGRIPRDVALAIVDEIRDAVMEVLNDDPDLREDLLGRINEIVKRLSL